MGKCPWGKARTKFNTVFFFFQKKLYLETKDKVDLPFRLIENLSQSQVTLSAQIHTILITCTDSLPQSPPSTFFLSLFKLHCLWREFGKSHLDKFTSVIHVLTSKIIKLQCTGKNFYLKTVHGCPPRLNHFPMDVFYGVWDWTSSLYSYIVLADGLFATKIAGCTCAHTGKVTTWIQ